MFSSPSEVLAHLKEKETLQRNPNPEDLRALCEYVKSAPLQRGDTSSVASSSKPDGRHFFCTRAQDATRETATYLLYLFSYNRSGMVENWMSSLERVVVTCDLCARGFCMARRTFMAKYISKFPIEAQRNFDMAVDKWQAEQILRERARAAPTIIDLEDSRGAPTVIDLEDEDLSTANGIQSLPSLLELPSPLLQLLFGLPNDHIIKLPSVAEAGLRDTILRTVTATESGYVTTTNATLVKLGLLPTVIVLARDGLGSSDAEANKKVRYWARVQINACGGRPIKPLEWIGLGLAQTWAGLLPGGSSAHDDAQNAIKSLEDDMAKWKAVLSILESGSLYQKTLEEFVLGSGSPNLLASIASHIADKTPVFPILLKIFSHIIKAYPNALLWLNADPSMQFALTTVNQIQNNPVYIDMLIRAFDPTYESSGQKVVVEDLDQILSDLHLVPASSLPSALARSGKGKERLDHPSDWIVDWFPGYLSSIQDLDSHRLIHAKKDAPPSVDDLAFSDAMASSMGFFMQTLQPRRFTEDFRATAIVWGFRTFSSLCTGSQVPSASLARYIRKVIVNALEIHSNTIVSVAIGTTDHRAPAWTVARSTAQQFLHQIFVIDGDMIRSLYTHLGGQANEARRRKSTDPQDTFPTARVATVLWLKTYELTSSTLLDGIPALMQGLRRFAHLPVPGGRAWSHESLEFWRKEQRWAQSVTTLRSTMKAMKDAFGTNVTTAISMADNNRLQRLWGTQDFPQLVMHLLLCSDPDVHDAMIGLIQTTYEDVDSRVDCIRSMFTKYPVESIKALIDFLNNWNHDVQDMPTAVETARWVVRCFTDIIDVLCRQTNVSTGFVFLSDEVFLQTTSDGLKMTDYLLQLWDSMTSSLANIFKLTSRWAPFFDNQEMVDWMQDALIFGRLLVEETHNFEAAITDSLDAQHRPEGAIEASSNSASKLVDHLEPILENLLAWLRLTEVETLHQSYELLKLLLNCCTRSRPNDVSTESFKRSCFIIENFCRRVKRHKTLLDEAQLSELFDLIWPFIKRVEVLSDSEDDVLVTEPKRQIESAPSRPKPTVPAVPAKNAFAEMMTKAGRSATPSVSSRATPVTHPLHAASKQSTTPRASPAPRETISDDDEFPDDFDLLSVADLARAEREAASKSMQRNLERMHAKPTFKAGSIPTKHSISKSSVPSRVGGSNSVLGRLRQEAVQERMNKDVLVPRGTMSHMGSKRNERKPIYNAAANVRSRATSESSDTSDSEDDGGLGALQKLQKEDTKPVNRPKIQILKATRIAPRMSEAERQRLAAYRTKMRLKPDIGALFRTIVLWDPVDRGPIKGFNLNKIQNKFKTPEDYQQAFTALFFQELRDQSRSELDDEGNNNKVVPLNVEIINKQHSDEFTDLELSPAGKNMLDGWYVSDTDLCIMRRGDLQVFAMVRGFKRANKNITINVRVHNSREKYGLDIKDRWVLVKHMNLSTAIREFSALKGMPYYEPEMLDSILEAKPRDLPEVTAETARKAMAAYNVNEPQARAIIGAMRVKGFALIQGPPGTGKTKTIGGLAGRFMDNRPTSISLKDAGDTRAAKLLICAPSNAAIDEVTRRLKDGVPSSSGKLVIPRIIRIGNEGSMNPAVKDVSLDALVEARVSSAQKANGKGDTSSDISRAEQALDKIKKDREALQSELQSVGDNEQKRQALEGEMQALQKARIEKSRQLDRARDAARDVTRQMDGARREAREAILREADIICGTLAGVGQDSLQQYEFDTVIIDEAAQSVEVSALIPLKYRCTRCILVGDPKQLPPTVISTTAQDFGYNQSLFVRMSTQYPDAMHLLSIQYRMHPDISRLPSKAFYDGKLQDGPGMAQKTLAPWHAVPALGTYRFFNVEGSESTGGRRSVVNRGEIAAIINLYRGLRAEYGKGDGLLGRVGVVTPYKAQQSELRFALRNNFGERVLEEIDIGTIDGFQGQEKDIIILSTVRSGTNQTSIGFVQDQRRMNVALTRAKSSLFIFGNGATLARSDATWRGIVQDAQERKFYVNYDPSMFLNLKADPSLLRDNSATAGRKAIGGVPTPANGSGISDQTKALDGDSQAYTRLPSSKGAKGDKKRVLSSSTDLDGDSGSTRDDQPVKKKSKLRRIGNDGNPVRKDDDGVTATTNDTSKQPKDKEKLTQRKTKPPPSEEQPGDVNMDFFSEPPKNAGVPKKRISTPASTARPNGNEVNLSKKSADRSTSTANAGARPRNSDALRTASSAGVKPPAKPSGADSLFIKKKKSNKPSAAVPLQPPSNYGPPR